MIKPKLKQMIMLKKLQRGTSAKAPLEAAMMRIQFTAKTSRERLYQFTMGAVPLIKCTGVFSVCLAMMATPSYAVISNTVTATGSSPGQTNDVQVTDTETVDVEDLDPKFSVTNTTPTTNVTSAGTTINYTINVDNTGNSTLRGVAISDVLAQDGTNTNLTLSGPTGDLDGDNELDLDEVWGYTASYTVNQSNMDDPNDLVSTVSVTTTETGATPVEAIATTTLTPAAAAMQVSGATNVTSVNAATNVITNTVTVTNTGGYSVNGINLSDGLYSYECATSGAANIASLAPGASEDCVGTYTVTQNDMDTDGGGDSVIDSTTSVAGTSANSLSMTGNYASSVGVVINNSLQIVKTSDKENTPVSAGDIITYTFDVTNNGNVTLEAVHVSDSHNASGDPITPAAEVLQTDAGHATLDSTDAVANGSWDSLAPGDTIRFTATYEVKQNDVDTLQQ